MKISQAAGGAALNAFNALMNGGTLVIYSGTEPTNPDTALSGNTALVTATFSATAFATASYSSPNMTAAASFTAGSYAPSASGTATFARAFESGGSAVADFTVGTSGTDLIIGNTSIVTGTNVSFSLTSNMPVD